MINFGIKALQNQKKIIEAADISTLSEICTPAVREAIPVCAQMIIQELD